MTTVTLSKAKTFKTLEAHVHKFELRYGVHRIDIDIPLSPDIDDTVAWKAIEELFEEASAQARDKADKDSASGGTPRANGLYRLFSIVRRWFSGLRTFPSSIYK